MSKLSRDKRDKIILVAFVTIVASAAIGFFVIKPQRARLQTAREELQKSKDQLDRGHATLKTSEQVNQMFNEATRKLQEHESAMAAPNDMYSWLIQTLNTFSIGRRVDIPQFGRELPTDVGIFPKFPYRAALFNLRGSANYHDFGKFLADFENTYPYIRVQNIELDPMTEGRSEKLNFKMELLTLVRPSAL
jgi:Tfp pilus assembly protein PilO